ncbi:MAG: ATPase domain-containing protein [Candidatus Altiarchaeota archaeon]
MKRVKTGIDGLDQITFGGLPEGSTTLITGSCGTGKTILTLQFLYKGALEGEPGLYITFEESREKILQQAEQFNWDLESLEKKKLFNIFVAETDDIGDTLESIKEAVSRINAKRLVLDSLTTMMEHGVIYHSNISKDMSNMRRQQSKIKFPPKEHSVSRRDVYYIIGEINQLNVTSLLVSEVADQSSYLSRDTISEFAADGVILLQISTLGGEHERLLSVRKMRSTKIDVSLFPLKFTTNGIMVEV